MAGQRVVLRVVLRVDLKDNMKVVSMGERKD
jgi:hypothetical protein